MNRRGFIGTLLGSVSALALDPATLLWRPESAGLPPVEESALLSMEPITRKFLHLLTERLDGRMRGDRIILDGDFGEHGALNHQLSVSCEAPSTLGIDGYSVPRYLRPAAYAVANTMCDPQRRGVGGPLRGFGVLPMCEAQCAQSAVVTEHGVSARGMLYWHPDFGEQIRFDVLCGWDA
jgi:hypothetical protein